MKLNMLIDRREHNSEAFWKFHNIGHQEIYQASICPQSIFQKSRKTWRNLEMLTDMMGKFFGSLCESSIEIRHQEHCLDSTCPLNLFLEFWRTWRFLMNLEMVSDRRKHLLEFSIYVC